MLELGLHCSAWIFLLRSTGSNAQASAVAAHGLSSCSSQALDIGPTVMVHRLSCSTYGIFLDQGPNLCLLHWQVDSFTTEPPGKPTSHIKFLYFVVSDQAHVHLSFQSSTSHRCGVSSCCQSSHHTGLK